jgi:hypothetical protein
MSKYREIAIKAADYASKGNNPRLAWEKFANELYRDDTTGLIKPAATKSCPKSAFLGLAEDDEIIGIPEGKYTKSTANKRYAKTALRLLRENESLAESLLDLRDLVEKTEGKKIRNNQIDVVIALWCAKKFVGQESV